MILTVLLSIAIGINTTIACEGYVTTPSVESVAEVNVTPVYSVEELELLYAITWAESGNEGLNGQIAVANVIINRINSQYFPNTVDEVVYQGNGRQFNGVWRSNFGYYTEETVTAVGYALTEPMFAPDVVYFANTDIATDSKFIQNVIEPYKVELVNRHTFARDKRGF